MVRKITEKVYVIEHEEAANNVVIIGKKGVILVDTSLFPEKARRIAKFVKEFTMKTISLVLNTHYHPDHTFGNVAFDCPIVAHTLTREFMEQFNVDYFNKIGVEYFRPKLPDVLFDDIFEYEDGVQLKFIHAPGHTPDSSYVYLPKESVLIAGDTVINTIHPEIVEDSNLSTWIKTLETLPKVNHVIPGHGEIGDYNSIVKMQEYIEKIRKLTIGEIRPADFERDENFSKRLHPEMLEWSLKNILSKSVR
ncbi:MAG: MBL fold metallo-hydrolase [Fervidobacterium sp.]